MDADIGKGWFRSACMIYGASVSTSLIPILAEIASDSMTSLEEKGLLMGFYLPYVVFPFWLMVIAVVSEDVFNDGTVGGEREGKKRS